MELDIKDKSVKLSSVIPYKTITISRTRELSAEMFF